MKYKKAIASSFILVLFLIGISELKADEQAKKQNGDRGPTSIPSHVRGK